MSLPVLLHLDLWDHIKTERLADRLSIPVPHAVGVLATLWRDCSRFKPDGDLSGLTDKEIARRAGWGGAPEAFVSALRDLGWLDGDQVHDFAERQGKEAINRVKDAARKQAARDKGRKSLSESARTETGRASESAGQKQDSLSLSVSVAGSLAVACPESVPTHTDDVARARAVFMQDALKRLFAAMPKGHRKDEQEAARALSDLQPTPELVAQIEAGILRLVAEDDEWRRGVVPRLHRVLAKTLWREEPAAPAQSRASPAKPDNARALAKMQALLDNPEEFKKATT